MENSVAIEDRSEDAELSEKEFNCVENRQQSVAISVSSDFERCSSPVTASPSDREQPSFDACMDLQLRRSGPIHIVKGGWAPSEDVKIGKMESELDETLIFKALDCQIFSPEVDQAPQPLLSGSHILDLERQDRVDMENSLAQFIWQDDSSTLVSFIKKIASENHMGDYSDEITAWKLLQMSCTLDSVNCVAAIIEGCEITWSQIKVNELGALGKAPIHHAAEMHSYRCIGYLLSRGARLDVRSNEGLIPLDVALCSQRLSVNWNLDDPIEDLVSTISEKDLRGLKLLVERTKGVTEIAHSMAMQGGVVGLTALFLVVGESMKLATSREGATIYESVIKKAIALGQVDINKRFKVRSEESSPSSLEDYESLEDVKQMRQLLLTEIELLQFFKATTVKGSNQRSLPPLILAAEAAAEAVLKLLVKGNLDVNETDAEGNSALHWCLRTNSSKDPSIVCILVHHGANVNQRNQLGLTPVHVAAASGNVHALQVLLFREPECVDSATETRETPLFYAVKNDHMGCAELLLSFGANEQFLNLRRQRPIDLAKTQDMRFLLTQLKNFSWHHHKLDNEKNPIADAHESSYDCKEERSSKGQPLSVQTVAKMEICKYYESASGCVRGVKCYYAHGEAELRRPRSMVAAETKQQITKFSDELKRKVFIGGLPPSVDSDELREFFETYFGPVEDAVVMGSQAGEHVHSRGFGFATFKHEDSVAAAVDEHFVTIHGKKVEIKGAVPKGMTLPTTSSTSPSASAPLQKMPFLFKRPLPLTLTPTSVSDQSDDARKKQGVSWAEKVVGGNASSPKRDPPFWVRKFVQWLPDFLRDVSKRPKEGKWYPLSSLKGDFRATCGMELDHNSLGYVKLSDFVRSLPGLCRMKIVPVGQGLATHMVLLEPQANPDGTASTTLHHRDLIDKCRYQSYADAVYRGTRAGGAVTPREKATPAFVEEPEEEEEGPSVTPERIVAAVLGEDSESELEPESYDRFLTFLKRDWGFFTPWNMPWDQH